MASSKNHLTLRSSYPPNENSLSHNLSNLPSSQLFHSYSPVLHLPLATPEDSDLDTGSIASTRDNTSSNFSTNTVPHIAPPYSNRSATLPPSANTQRQHQGGLNGHNGSGFNQTDSTITLNAGTSLSFTAASSSTAFVSTATTGQLRSKGSSLKRRSTFPRPLGGLVGNPNASRIHRINLLDGEALEIPLEKYSVGQELFNEVCQYLSLRERDFFGLYFFKNASLNVNASNSTVSNVNPSGTFRRMPWQSEAAEDCAIHHRGIPFWLKMDKRVVDQCKKNTRLWFGVRIYPPRPHEEVFDEITRYLLCLQLRQDLLSGRLACSFFTHTLLAAYWAQSELGDWDLHVLSSSNSTDYLVPLCLAAPLSASSLTTPEDDSLKVETVAEEERLWSASRTGPPQPPPLVRISVPFLQQVNLFHRSLRGLVPLRADILFLQIARKLPTYGIDFHRIQNPTRSTVHVNFTKRLSKETSTFQRSQSLRLKSTNFSNKTKNRLSFSPHNFSDSRSSNYFPAFSSTGLCNGCDSGHQYPFFLGVFHGGIYLYRGRLRLEYHPWSAIVKMAYRRASFRLCLRLANSERDGLVQILKCECGTTALAKRIYRSCVDHHALFRLRRLEVGERTTPWSSIREPFPFATGTRLRRLHFSGLHSSSGPSSASVSTATAPTHLMSSMAVCTRNPSTLIRTSTPLLEARSRPLSEPDVRASDIHEAPQDHGTISEADTLSTRQGSSRFVRSAHKLFSRLFSRKSTMRHKRGARGVISPNHHLHASLSDQGLQQNVDPGDPSTDIGGLILADGFESTSLSTATAPSTSPSISPFYTPSEWNRPPLPGPLWRMSSVDATPGMLFEPSGGLTVSRDGRLVVYQDAADRSPSMEWRGCRATWGVSENPNSPAGTSSFGPRRLFFEVRLNGNEPVRVGWATENANQILGEDARGFAYQTSPITPALNEDTLSEDWFNMTSGREIDKNSQLHHGALVIGGASVDVIGSCHGDVIGCYLDLDSRLAHWTKNGVTSADMTISIARFPPRTVFFPACAIRNSSVTFNFGDTPFAYGPMLVTGEYSNSNWLPLASTSLIAEIVGCSYSSPARANQLPIRLTPNPRTGWNLIPTNSSGAILSPDKLCVRAILHSGWQTLHASDFIMPWSECVSNKKLPFQSKLQAPSVYFEVHLLESLITTPGAGVFFGFSTLSNCTSPPVCPLGSDRIDTFGIVFEQNASSNQTCLVHAGVKRAYGKALHRGDVVGCVLNPQSGLVFWSINGEYLGHIVQICAAQQHAVNGSASTAADDVISIPLAPGQDALVFTPVFSLANTSIEVNFGDGAVPLKHVNKHTNCVPLCHYRRLLEGDLFYLNLLHQLPPPPSSLNPKSDSEKKPKPQNHTIGINPAPVRHPHSFAQCRDTTNHKNEFTVVHKSASCNSAPTATAMNFLVSSDIMDTLRILRSRIPLVSVKTSLWRRESTDLASPRRPITSPTFAAPWSKANQILPIVRTHRVAVSTLASNAATTAGQLLETEIDMNGLDNTLTAMALALDGSLRRSASGSMHEALIRHLCGQSQQSSASAANQSSSSSLVERRMAQIPLVPTKIVHTRSSYANDYVPVLSQQTETFENLIDNPNKTLTSLEAGEDTLARRRYITDLTLPPSIAEDDRSISSPKLTESN